MEEVTTIVNTPDLYTPRAVLSIETVFRNLQPVIQTHGVCAISMCASVSKKQYDTWAEHYEQASANLDEQYKVALHLH